MGGGSEKGRWILNEVSPKDEQIIWLLQENYMDKHENKKRNMYIDKSEKMSPFLAKDFISRNKIELVSEL